jgi:hypothetical protein
LVVVGEAGQQYVRAIQASSLFLTPSASQNEVSRRHPAYTLHQSPVHCYGPEISVIGTFSNGETRNSYADVNAMQVVMQNG